MPGAGFRALGAPPTSRSPGSASSCSGVYNRDGYRRRLAVCDSGAGTLASDHNVVRSREILATKTIQGRRV